MNSSPHFATVAADGQTPPKPVVRKKFAVPPVKVACLDCRASRTRCDGKQDCSNCIAKGKTCVYAQSRRGGSRIRKRKAVKLESSHSSNGDVASSGSDKKPNMGVQSMGFQSITEFTDLPSINFLAEPAGFVTPGAGLKQLDMSFDDTEFIFESIFGNQMDPQDSGYGSSEFGTSVEPEEASGPVRVYLSDEDILNAYYVFIHPYFPILPAPASHQVIDRPALGSRISSDCIFTSPLAPNFEPGTPLSLALSATLALIPHPSDPAPSSIESILLRREQAQAFAQATLQSIEIESELIDSSIQPSEALSNDPLPMERPRFHPQAPLENESVLALLMLSTYEYAQRGNIAKMRNRSGQALIKAMELGLHSRGHEEGEDAEANRRAWWMTYICVCQGTIFSNTLPPMLLYDPRFTTSGPTIASDVEAWPDFLQAQQVIVSATQFVMDLDATLKSNSDTSAIWTRMLELDSIMEPLITKADSWVLTSSPPASLDWSELSVAHALRNIARIKLNSARIKIHRYCAFSDIPVFTKRHCDLAPISQHNTGEEGRSPSCSCSTTFHTTIQSLMDVSISPQANSPYMSVVPSGCELLPFTSHFSSKVCLRSAFNIARSFQLLPYPPAQLSTYSATSPNPAFFNNMDDAQNPILQPPRMVPMFACCAMQSSYAMMVLSYKSRSMGFVGTDGSGFGDSSANDPVRKLLGRLEEGLGMILDALENYAISYEAMGGMRDQIQVAVQSIRRVTPDEGMMS